MLVCPSCFGESTILKQHFAEHGTHGTCPTCGTHDTTPADASTLSDLFSGLEAHYEPLCGDLYRLRKDGVYGMGEESGNDSLVTVLREDWDLFSDLIDDDDAEAILKCVWPDYIGEYGRRGSTLWREVGEHWATLRYSLMHERRFFYDTTTRFVVQTLLDSWVEELGSPLGRTVWWRARIQPSKETCFQPLEMGPPPPGVARGGRANPAGIPHLYVASDVATAIAEVRAEPGDWVTVVRVELQSSKMTVLDLTELIGTIDPFDHMDLDYVLMVRQLLETFAQELSRPVRAADSELEYVVTQFLSEYFRCHGYGGIVYNSAVAQGVNAVFFNAGLATISEPRTMRVLSKSVEVVDVQSGIDDSDTLL